MKILEVWCERHYEVHLSTDLLGKEEDRGRWEALSHTATTSYSFKIILCALLSCLHVCLCEVFGSPRTGSTGRCETACWCWEQDSVLCIMASVLNGWDISVALRGIILVSALYMRGLRFRLFVLTHSVTELINSGMFVSGSFRRPSLTQGPCLL